MSFDWKTLINVSLPDDGWVDPLSSTGARVNRVRDVIALPYGEHKSIVIWVQESPGAQVGTGTSAVVYPSLRLLAAVIDQTRAVESTLPFTKRVQLGEATSSLPSGAPNIGVLYGPIQAVLLSDTSTGSASFLVSFDWGTETTSGSSTDSNHQLIYATVTNSVITLQQTYDDPDQGANTTSSSLLVAAGTGKAVWFKSKTGGALHTAKVVSVAPLATTITVGPTNDLPTGVTSLDGFLGWQGDTDGFLHDAFEAPSDILPYTVSGTSVSFGAVTRIPLSSVTNVKLLAGQRLRSVGVNTFAAIGVEESFSGGGSGITSASYSDSYTSDFGTGGSTTVTITTGTGITGYSSNVPYDSSATYDDNSGDVVNPPPPPPPSGSYNPAIPYDSAIPYDNDSGPTDNQQILSENPQVFVYTYSGGNFILNGTSAPGQLYRRDAITGSEVILGNGITQQSSYEVVGKGNRVAVVNSAYDAIPPLDSSRFYGQEVLFDPTTAPVRMTYPPVTTPFNNKYVSNASQISVSMALVNTGAYAFYVSPSSLSVSRDIPLRATYFEHTFLSFSTDPFPTDPDDPDDPVDPDDPLGGVVYSDAETAVKMLFGHTTLGRMVCLDADIDLNGLTLNTIDSSGVLWLCTGIEGWWNLPEATGTDLPKGQEDGSYPTEGRYNQRVITVNGAFLPPNKNRVNFARDKLFRAINTAHRSGVLKTSDDQYKRQAEIWLSGKPEIDTVNQHGRNEFSIGFRVPDPIKYEVISENPDADFRSSQSVLGAGGTGGGGGLVFPFTFPFDFNFDSNNPSGDITATNFGNYPVQPIIILEGPLTADPQIVNSTTGQRIVINGGVPAGQVIKIDTNEKEVYVDGVGNFRTKLTAASDWMYLRPGPNTIELIGTSAALGGAAPPKLTVQWRSGWIG